MPTRYKAAAVLASPCLFDLERTVDKCCRLMDEAAAQGARLIAFPETFCLSEARTRPPFGTQARVGLMRSPPLAADPPHVRFDAYSCMTQRCLCSSSSGLSKSCKS